MPSSFCSISEAVAELQAGRFIILVDDEHRENEGEGQEGEGAGAGSSCRDPGKITVRQS